MPGRVTPSRSSASTTRHLRVSMPAWSRTSGRLGTSLRCAESGCVTLETLFDALQEGAIQDLNLVLKGDVVGSVEAAVSELSKIQHPEVRVNVIHSAVGGITENDVMLASASNAMLVGMLKPVSEEVTLGEAEVRALIRISRIGTIAGSYITSGTMRRGASARVI